MGQKSSKSIKWSDFTKVRRIGKGTFGEAWLVKKNKDEIQYVIKQIDASKVC
jgi:hypothetical protein